MATPVHIIRKHYMRLARPALRREAKEKAHAEEIEKRALVRKKRGLETNYSDVMEALKFIERHPSRSAVKRLVDIKNSHPDKRVIAKAASILLKWASNPAPRKKHQRDKW